jgi:hypothetical protein
MFIYNGHPIVVVASHNKSHQNPIKSKHLIQINYNPFKCLFSLFLFHGHTTLFLTTMKRPSTRFTPRQPQNAVAVPAEPRGNKKTPA